MATKEHAEVEVDVNGQPAENKLNALQVQAKELKIELQKAFEAGDVKSYEKQKAALGKIKKEARSLQKQMFDVDKVMRNLGGATPKELRTTLNLLNREFNSGDVKRGSKEWVLLKGRIQKVKTELNKVQSELRTTQPLLTRVSNGFNKYFGMITAGAATLTGVIFSFRKATDKANDFGESVASLSALTGLVGDDLDYLRNRALEFSGSTTENGIRITKSSQAIVDAYTQMGSKRPELLKDKEALASVTEQSIILAEASKMKLVPATNSLAVSMNQFNAAASEAPRYVNAIAAGSKVGAGDVEYIAKTLENAGTSADKAGLQIEETIAVIETIAPKFSEPGRAGTQLKNVFVKLQTGAKEFNPAIVGMENALTNLSNANLSTTEMVKMFGVENLNAAQTLVDNKDAYVEYKNAVTDTNVATEQAITNTATNKAKLESARQSLNKVTIELGEKLAPALTFSTSGFSKLVKGSLVTIKVFKDYKGVIVPTTAAIVAYSIAVNASTIKTKIFSTATKLADKVMGFFNKTVKANPLALFISLLVAAGTAIYMFSQKLSAAEKAQKALDDVMTQAKKNIVDQKVEMENLLRIAQDETKSKGERMKAIQSLNKLSPEYLGNLDLENINTKEATKSTELYIAALERKARVEAATEKLKEVERQIIDLKQEGAGAELSFWQNAKAGITSYGNASSGAYEIAKIAASNYAEKEEELLAIKQKILDTIRDTNNEETGNNPTSSSGADDDGGGDGSSKTVTIEKYLKENAEQFELWKAARQQYLSDQQEWELSQKYGAEALQNEINSIEEYEQRKAEAKKLAEQTFQDAFSEDFEMEDEEAIAESPEMVKAMLTASYEYDLWAQTYEGRVALLDKALAKNEISEKEHADRVKKIDNEITAGKIANAQQYFQIGSQLIGTLSNIYVARKNRELTAAGDNEEKIAAIESKYAKKEQNMAVAQARINGALSIMSMWATAPNPIIGAIYTAVAIGVTEAEVAAIKSEQFAEGKIPVTGLSDGKTYQARPIKKPTSPGIVKGPALISEIEDEMIIDGPTTKELVFNYPEIVEGIRQISMGVAPQFATGQIPATTTSENTTEVASNNTQSAAMLRFAEAIELMIKHGIKAYCVMDEDFYRNFQEGENEYDDFMGRVN